MCIQEIGQLVRERRRELGITQLTLGQLADLSKNTIYKFEAGKSNPGLGVVLRLLEVLGLEVVVQPKSVGP